PVGVGGREVTEAVAGAFDDSIGMEMVPHGDTDVVHHGVLHRHFNVLPLTGLGSLQQCGQNPRSAMDTSARVSNSGPWSQGRTVRQAGDTEGAACRLRDGVKALVGAPRTVGAKPFDGGVNEPRIKFS